ncbi:unnamed protein product [Arctogadus glacialis]
MVVDALAFIQRYQHLGSSTFHELQGKYLRQLLGILPDKCDCIHFVGDRYDVSPAECLKGEELEKRMKTCPNKMKEYKPLYLNGKASFTIHLNEYLNGKASFTIH